jgi:diamine N-acetyltransferase
MKIKIRPLKEKDAYTSVKWRNIPEIWRYTTFFTDKEITIEDELSWIRKVMSNETCRRFAILADDKYIGNIYLTDIKDKTGEYHIFIGEKEYWGKGIAKEASRLIIEFGKNILKLKKIELGVRPENKNAMGLYKSLGFKKYGQKKGFIRMKLEL